MVILTYTNSIRVNGFRRAGNRISQAQQTKVGIRRHPQPREATLVEKIAEVLFPFGRGVTYDCKE